MATTAGASARRADRIDRWLTVRQQLAAGLLLATVATLAAWAGLGWLDAQTPDPPGFDATTLLLGALALVPGGLVGWAVWGRIERRLADLAVYATALAHDRPAVPRPVVGGGALGELVEGLNGVAARLAAQEGRLREQSAHSARLTAPLREAAAQEERNRLARDLHDTIKQQLFSIGVTVAAAEARWEADPPGVRAALADIRALSGAAQVEMRALLTQLRPTPVAQIGLLAALEEQLSALAYRSEVAIDADLAPLPEGLTLLPGAEDALFRIAQEGLANIARHARARHVRVAFGLAPGHTPEPQAALTIHDDGQGFDAAATEAGRGMGLRNMRARAADLGGSLAVTAAPGAGTTLTVLIPLYVSPASAAEHEQELASMEQYADQFRRYRFFRIAGSVASVAMIWLFIALALRPEITGSFGDWLAWERPGILLGNLAVVGLLLITLGASLWADQLARRFRTQVGDAPALTLRFAQTEHLAHTVEYGLTAHFLPVLVTVFLRGTSLAGLGEVIAFLSYFGMIWLFVQALWALIKTERALSAITAQWTDRTRLDAARTEQVATLIGSLVLLVICSAYLRLQVASDPADFTQWLRATAPYPLFVCATIAGWQLAWTHQRLQRLTAGGTRGTVAGV